MRFGVYVATVAALVGGCRDASKNTGGQRAAAVSVTAIERGSIALSRTLSGTLQAPDAVVVAAQTEGLVVEVTADLGDTIESGRVLVRLDDRPQRQLVSQATAERAVAEANHAEAQRALALAKRELGRIEQLAKRGVSSEAQLDAARANDNAKSAQVEVTAAHVKRATAALEAARIALSQTKITATWSGDAKRVVAERFVDVGALVSANSRLMSVVQLDPIEAVVFVAEKDYARLRVGLGAQLAVDAFPQEKFAARVARIAPVFSESSRQARVELSVRNADGRLKPGMFVRATIQLAEVADTILVPVEAITTRDTMTGVFLLNEDDTVAWRPVKTGIGDGRNVQLLDGPDRGRVVTLGHQLLDDGSKVTIPDGAAP
ncbi:MAG: efflux RND transporter periplasmic adaptor subunit [Deltaproteobacteria bacterium]